jgi:hypothetical protein
LARFLAHPDPAVRQLVARGPHADPKLIDQLLDDPHLPVREAMANCPRLPVQRTLTLLDDPELAESAAANPALPPEQMNHILDNIET